MPMKASSSMYGAGSPSSMEYEVASYRNSPSTVPPVSSSTGMSERPSFSAKLPIPMTSEHSKGLSSSPASSTGVLLPQNHQFSNGCAYLEIPIDEPQEPALRRGSPISRTRTISPSEMVTMAK